MAHVQCPIGLPLAHSLVGVSGGFAWSLFNSEQ